MRTLAITQNVTLDGSIEMLGDWFDPRGGADQDTSDLRDELGRQQDAADAVVLGRQTFEDMRGYWPQQTDDTTGVTEYLNYVPKYVVSSTITDPGWQRTTVLSGDPTDEIRELKRQPGRRLFPDGVEIPSLKLRDAKAFRSGIAFSRYVTS